MVVRHLRQRLAPIPAGHRGVCGGGGGHRPVGGPVSGYRPRRLRSTWARAPRWVITSKDPISRETAEELKAAWLRAGRAGFAVVSSNIEIRRLR
jgi:hypothetical protein